MSAHTTRSARPLYTRYLSYASLQLKSPHDLHPALQADRAQGGRHQNKFWKKHKGWGTRSGYPDHVWRNYGVREHAHGPLLVHPGPIATLKKVNVDDEVNEDDLAHDLAMEYATASAVDEDSQTYLAGQYSGGLSIWESANIKAAKAQRRTGGCHPER